MSTERRIHVPSIPGVGGLLVLDDRAARHVRVLRLAVGDVLTLFDGRGARASATLVRVGDAIEVRVERILDAVEPRLPIVLVQCLPKGGKIDDIVRAATELGVDAIRFATSAHSVPRPDERWEKKRDRLERIATEAARQAERDDVPELYAPKPVLEHASEASDDAIRIVLCGRTGGPPISAADRPIWLVVGPEGGLSSAELEALDALGYRRMKVAPTVLRVETAAIAALAVARIARGGR